MRIFQEIRYQLCSVRIVYLFHKLYQHGSNQLKTAKTTTLFFLRKQSKLRKYEEYFQTFIDDFGTFQKFSYRIFNFDGFPIKANYYDNKH